MNQSPQSTSGGPGAPDISGGSSGPQSIPGSAGGIDRRLCVAPMVGVTDRWARALYRALCPGALLFTEMFVARMLLFTARTPHRVQRLPGQDDPARTRSADPTVLQLAGHEPEALMRGAELGQELGYVEINLNLGCPSKKVVKGGFGACQMQHPEQVAELLAAMGRACDLPLSVKTRTGLGDEPDGGRLRELLRHVGQAGCSVLYLHARNAVLKGLTAAQNRAVPPLRYDIAARVRDEFPDLTLVVNGGIRSQERALELLGQHQGVMIGRAAQSHPGLLAQLGRSIHGRGGRSLSGVVAQVLRQAESAGEPPVRVMRHLVGLAREQRGAKIWRRRVTDRSLRAEDCVELLEALP